MKPCNFYKAHKDLKPEGIAELNETGRKLAAVAAEELAKELTIWPPEEES